MPHPEDLGFRFWQDRPDEPFAALRPSSTYDPMPRGDAAKDSSDTYRRKSKSPLLPSREREPAHEAEPFLLEEKAA